MAAPSAPWNLVGLEDDAAGGVEIYWHEPEDWGGEEGSYNIFRQIGDPDPNDSWFHVDSVSHDVLDYLDTTPDDGVRVSYKVNAQNSDGVSDFSDTVTVTRDIPTPTITSMGVTGDDITVNWDQHTESSVIDYRVFRRTDESSFSQIAQINDETNTSYTDTGLLDGERYFYEVETYSSWTSARSDWDHQTTTLPAPSSFSATENSGDIDTSWTDNSDNEDAFVVYRAEQGKSYSQVASLSAGTTSWTDTNAKDGRDYLYHVKSQTEHSTSASNDDTATTPFPSPGSLSASATGGDVDLSWNNNTPDESGVRVFRRQGTSGTYTQIADLSSGTTTYADNNLDHNQQYQYYVQTYTDYATADSNTDTATTTAEKPDAPQNLTASASSDDVSLNWDSTSWNGDVGHYDVYRGTITGSYSHLSQVSSGTTSYNDTGLLDGERYFYVVDATNSQGTSGDSNEADATTEIPAPTISTSVSQDDITVSWTDNSDNTSGFQLQRNHDGGAFSVIASPSTSPYNDTGLLDGEEYTYRIRALTNHTESPWSAESSKTTTLPNPTGLNLSQ